MDDKIAQLILDELFSSLETLETQTAAILQFLKEKGGASEEQLAPYLEQAARASSIKRRAARVRIDYLLSGITNPPKKAVEQDAAKGEQKSGEPAEKPEGKTQEQAQERDGQEQSANQKGETKAEGKTEVKIGKTEEHPQDEQHRSVAKAPVEEAEKEKRSADRGKEKERKNKPEPEGRDHKTEQKGKNEEGKDEKGKDKKRKDEKESGQERRAAKSSTGK
jgi:hypothetical protein